MPIERTVAARKTSLRRWRNLPSNRRRSAHLHPTCSGAAYRPSDRRPAYFRPATKAREKLIERLNIFCGSPKLGPLQDNAYRTPFDPVYHVAFVYGAIGKAAMS